MNQTIQKSNQNNFIYIDEAAKYLKISVSTVRRLIAERKIAFTRAGKRRILVNTQDLDFYLYKNKTNSEY